MTRRSIIPLPDGAFTNRTLVVGAVALFVLFVVSAATLGAAVIAHDKRMAAREREAVAASIYGRAVALKDAFADAMSEAEVLERLARADLGGLHRDLGAPVHRKTGLASIYIADADGNLIFVSEQDDVAGSAARTLVPAVHRLAAGLRDQPQAHEHKGVSIGAGGEFLLLAYAFHAQNGAVPHPQPLMVVGVHVLSAGLLDELARDASIEGGPITRVDAADAAAEGKLELLNLMDDVPVRLTWPGSTPATSLFLAALPLLLVMALVLCVVFFVLMVRARRLAAALGESQAHALALVNRDHLTGLSSRGHFKVQLDEALRTLGVGRQLAVVFVDLDDFKIINDTHGHAIGDGLLQMVGGRLRACVGVRGSAARVGGDEFVLFVSYGGEDDLRGFLAGLYGTLREPVRLEGRDLRVEASIGVARAPHDATSSSELMRLADIALYRAKAAGGGTLKDFEPAFEQEQLRLRQTEQELVTALERSELTVLYQPQLDVESEHIVGFEALVRWDHPTRGRLPPSAFVPIAERSRLITRIDAYVLRRACADARLLPGVTISVNLSPVNLGLPTLVDDISATLRDTGLDPCRLELEITESAIIDPGAGAAATLTKLREKGIRLALDDFGTGHASLLHVRRYPVTKIKVDRSFIMNLGQQRDAAAIVEYVVRLGRSLGVTVTAEGVETREQLRFLRAFGAHHVQGYLFATPLPLSTAAKLLEQQHASGLAPLSNPSDPPTRLTGA